MDTIQTFKAARKVATPLLAIRTPDPAATMRGIADSFNGNAPPMVIWDAAAGLRQYNAAGAAELKKAGAPEPMMTTAFPEALKVAEALGQKTIVWLVNGHRVLEDLSCLQALWNLRDSFKTSRRQAVLVGVACTLPAELAQDVLILDEPLPSIEQLEAIVTGTLTAGGIEGTTSEVTTKCVDALLGLAAFPAEQATALSLTQQGVDLERLWERKRLMVEQTPGLSVWRGRERFDDLGGLANIKGFLRDVAAGELPPRAVLFVDEIEKAMAGAQGDTSGVSQALHGAILSWMQDSGATGIMLLGPPGCLAASTPITVRRGRRNSGRTYTIADLHRLFQGGLNCSRTWRKGIPTLTLSQGEEFISYRPIADVVCSGVKETFSVKIEGRKPFRATADHRFKTPHGFVKLIALCVGDEVVVRGEAAGLGRTVKHSRKTRSVRYHPNARRKLIRWKACPEGRIYPSMEEATLVVEADMNGLSLEEFIRVCHREPERAVEMKFLPGDLVVHHRDLEPSNNSRSNLAVMTKLAHDTLHGHENVRNFGNFTATTARIESIVEHGPEDTYDICMEGPHHNFLVNGVVIHNSGKSAVAKAFGNEAGIPTILCDLGAMKGSLVGQSEGNIRTALKVADAVGQGRVLVIATCNAIASLSPELRRRFTFGTFFVDLPDAEEREAIWQLYCRKYNVSGERPDDRGWTGAEIRQCADLAYRLRRPLTHAARFIVPVATSAAATIRRLRTEASGCYISASRDGVYTYDGPGTTDGGAVVGVIVSSPAARAIDLSDEAKN